MRHDDLDVGEAACLAAILAGEDHDAHAAGQGGGDRGQDVRMPDVVMPKRSPGERLDLAGEDGVEAEIVADAGDMRTSEIAMAASAGRLSRSRRSSSAKCIASQCSRRCRPT
jgi:hypothetical protein